MTTNIQVPRVNGVAVTAFLVCVAAGAAMSDQRPPDSAGRSRSGH